jgi:hypothetical protein
MPSLDTRLAQAFARKSLKEANATVADSLAECLTLAVLLRLVIEDAITEEFEVEGGQVPYNGTVSDFDRAVDAACKPLYEAVDAAERKALIKLRRRLGLLPQEGGWE